MSNVVFILGAGASKQAGAPLMSNFLDVANDLLRTNRVGESKECFERVFAAIGGLQAVHSKAYLDLNNIEAIFTALELGKVIRRFPGTHESQIQNTIADLKKVIVKTLETTLLFPTLRNSILAPEPYDAFAAVIKHLQNDAFPKRASSVITFNYDLAADFALLRAGLGPNYIIEPAPRAQAPIDLLKLHGSLNWAAESEPKSESKKIRPLHLDNYFQIYNATPFNQQDDLYMPIGSQLAEYFSKFAQPSVVVDPEPVIVPPSWNKADYHHALSDVWAAAARHLSEAEYVFVMGYSLPETDSFFRHLFALGSVGKTAFRRLIVFNPDTGVDARFRGLLGPGALARYEFHAMTFEQAIRVVRGLFPSKKS